MFEAVQQRPVYWDRKHAPDGLRHGTGDWRMAHTRIAREFPTLALAERYARRILGQRPGVPVEIADIGERQGGIRKYEHVATVSRDALGHTWTDLLTWEVLL